MLCACDFFVSLLTLCLAWLASGGRGRDELCVRLSCSFLFFSFVLVLLAGTSLLLSLRLRSIVLLPLAALCQLPTVVSTFRGPVLAALVARTCPFWAHPSACLMYHRFRIGLALRVLLASLCRLLCSPCGEYAPAIRISFFLLREARQRFCLWDWPLHEPICPLFSI